jgi:hypothetical protein
MDRFAGFSEVGDRGAEAKYGKKTGRRILALLDAAPPKGYANWTGPLIAKALLDVHVQYVWRFLRAQKIDLSDTRVAPASAVGKRSQVWAKYIAVMMAM